MKKSIITTMVLLLFAGITLSAQGYRVIVNNANPINALDKSDISKIFLKKQKKWDNGQTIAPINQGSGSKITADFSKAVHGKKPMAIDSYWQQALFSGQSTPPPVGDSDKDVIEYVKNNSNAIGYISAGSSSQGAKVLRVN